MADRLRILIGVQVSHGWSGHGVSLANVGYFVSKLKSFALPEPAPISLFVELNHDFLMPLFRGKPSDLVRLA